MREREREKEREMKIGRLAEREREREREMKTDRVREGRRNMIGGECDYDYEGKHKALHVDTNSLYTNTYTLFTA